jgi:hypothetical protein
MSQPKAAGSKESDGRASCREFFIQGNNLWRAGGQAGTSTPSPCWPAGPLFRRCGRSPGPPSPSDCVGVSGRRLAKALGPSRRRVEGANSLPEGRGASEPRRAMPASEPASPPPRSRAGSRAEETAASRSRPPRSPEGSRAARRRAGGFPRPSLPSALVDRGQPGCERLPILGVDGPTTESDGKGGLVSILTSPRPENAAKSLRFGSGGLYYGVPHRVDCWRASSPRPAWAR